MVQKYKYDVFISSKSEDYHLATEVYDFLTASGLSVFIASEELKKIGEAQYANAIDEVIDNSFHMVVVASSLSYIKSKWVKYEWSTFSNDLKSNYRNGNLITVLSSDIALKTLPASLRHQQSFHLDSFRNDILGYLPIPRVEDTCTDLCDGKENLSKSVAIFKFYSNENCQILLEGKPVGNIVGMSDEPYYLPVARKGDYRFKCINFITAEIQILKEHIEADEEKDVDIRWDDHKPFIPDQVWPENKVLNGESFTVELGDVRFDMIRVEGGSLEIGATKEQAGYAENNEFPAHNIITDKGNNRQNDLTLNDKADCAVKLGASLHMYTFAAIVGQLKAQIEAYENIVSSCKTFGVAVPVPMPTSIVNVQTEIIENFVKSLSERIGKEFASIVEITLRISLITTFGTYDRDGKDAAINDIRKNTHARCSDLLSSANFSKEIVDKILNPSQNRSLLQELTAYYRTYDKKVVLCDCGNRCRIGHGCMYCGRK